MTCYCNSNPYAFWDITYDEYIHMTSTRRMDYLRSLRLQIIEDKRKDRREQRWEKNEIEKWLKEEEQ